MIQQETRLGHDAGDTYHRPAHGPFRGEREIHRLARQDQRTCQAGPRDRGRRRRRWRADGQQKRESTVAAFAAHRERELHAGEKDPARACRATRTGVRQGA